MNKSIYSFTAEITHASIDVKKTIFDIPMHDEQATRDGIFYPLSISHEIV